MKKLIYLFLALFAITSYGQADFPEGIQISGGQPTVTTVNYLTTTDATGLQGKIVPNNVPITYTPINYAPSSTSIADQLAGIDTRLGQIGNVTAGVTTRVHLTGDNITVTAGTFFASNTTGKGATAAGTPQQTLSNNDDQKQYFTKDVMSVAVASLTTAPPGVYSGQLTVTSDPTPGTSKQRFTIEIYKCNNGGTPISSGITGAPVGDLGVTVVAILDSGLINVVASALTNIGVQGNLASTLTLNTGERLRYHVSAEKVGTDGGAVTMNVYYGTNYNSYYDIPVTFRASTVLNDSGVSGQTVANALNTLDTGKANLLGGNTFTGDQNLSSVNGNGRIGLLPIANNIAGTYNQPFYQSDFGYNIFRPYGTNLASRFYIIPNGTPSGATAKWEMFNTDYYANAVSYAGLNVFTENINNRINIGSNRGSGGGTRMDLLIYGDYIGSNSGAQNANSIQFLTNNDLLLNQWAGSIGFGTDTPDPFTLGVANQYTFRNPTATSTRVNIVGNGTTAGLYFGRPTIRTTAIENLLTTSDLGISLNASNTGTTLTKYAQIFGSNGALRLQNGGTFTNDGVNTLQVTGTISASAASSANQVVIKSQLDLKADLASPVFTGNPTAPNQSLGDNDTSIANTAFVVANSRPYKLWVGKLTQAGTSAPTTASVQENTFGGTIVWSYSAAGTYIGTLAAAFDTNKTYFFVTQNSSVSNAAFISLKYGSANTIELVTRDVTGAKADNLATLFLEIRTYP